MAREPGSRIRQAHDAALRVEALARIAQTTKFADLAAAFGAMLGALALRSGRLALLYPGPDAFEAHEAICCDAAGARLPDDDPVRFPRGDPMTEAIFDRAEPTLWRPHADGRRPVSSRALALWGEGNGDGASVALRIEEGWRLSLCVTARRDEPGDAFEARFKALQAPLRLLAAAATHPARRAIAALPAPALSPGQREILMLLAAGKRPAEIAVAGGVAEATVRNQIAALRRKLGARSNAHAVAIGVRRGVILA